jgi:hypothetical protein
LRQKGASESPCFQVKSGEMPRKLPFSQAVAPWYPPIAEIGSVSSFSIACEGFHPLAVHFSPISQFRG